MRLVATLAAALLALPSAQAQTGKTGVQWLSHAAFRITSPGGKVIVIDPALTVMPTTPPELKKLEALGKVDVLLVTHGHWDHITDAPALAKLNKIPLHAPGDLKDQYCIQQIARPGVEVYGAAIALVRALRARELKTAVVSSGIDCAAVLEAVGISQLFGARVDGIASRACSSTASRLLTRPWRRRGADHFGVQGRGVRVRRRLVCF